ncbi:hypothetical protein [Arcticibacter svalbardensis]|nr:hypothetical protein [Arcticibacter svalbardensis]
MNKILQFAVIAGVAFSTSSCCTVFKGSRESIRVVSNPPGATVEVDGI